LSDTVSPFLRGHSDAPVSVPGGVDWCRLWFSCRYLEYSMYGMKCLCMILTYQVD